MRLFLNVILILIVLDGCKPSKQTISVDKSEIDQINQSTEDHNWHITTNEAGDYMLYVEAKSQDKKKPHVRRQFYITNKLNDKVFEGIIYGGYVKWITDNKVEYFSPPGIMPATSEKDDFIMIYDIKEDRSYVKSSE